MRTCRLTINVCAVVAVYAILCLTPAISGAAGLSGEYELANDQIRVVVKFDNGVLFSEEITPQPEWSSRFESTGSVLNTDGNFSLGIVWTDWRAPGKNNNGDVFLPLTKDDFVMKRCDTVGTEGGNRRLQFYCEGVYNNLALLVTYQLGDDDFYFRRKLAITDTLQNIHFLDRVLPLKAVASVEGSEATVVNPGSFGQPAVIQWADGGAFFGLEYPAAEIGLSLQDDNSASVKCSQYMGIKIDSGWTETDWAVIGYAPEKRVKHWFMKYVDDIRVAALRPYTLYNSWYDLRSVEYPRVSDSNWMNEENVFRMIKLVRENMIDKHGIKLDAFVLDDGWDVYDSDWQLRHEQFPNGLKPLADKLKATNTDLGMWFGPTGGYSFRKRRLDWMKEHGYETTGEEIFWHASCLCVGGKKYSALLKKRTTDLVREHGVGFFKWDGFQFSCSEPDHGHPVGIYSRRAVLHSLFAMCDGVRAENPNTFLNITSGTWLSPWWVQYANQIWMDGGDYGYADVPSISERDAAITYRDFVLYDDFHNKGLWFPIANLMTHGIIKGKLQMLGGTAEPIDKFTDNALLYFARGVSMWELYISPEILTQAEWDAISQSIHWARDRFDLLRYTEMIGGDPTKRETYGYVHLKNNRGIIVVRNPYVEDNKIQVDLSPDHGLDYDANSLVVEKIYPDRQVFTHLYATGETIDIPLTGYEVAIYEIYPLADATKPLLAGARFAASREEGGAVSYTAFEITGELNILNPDVVTGMISGGNEISLDELQSSIPSHPQPVQDFKVSEMSEGGLDIAFSMDGSVESAEIAVLLKPSGETTREDTLKVKFVVSGTETEPVVHEQPGKWAWYTTSVKSNCKSVQMQISLSDSTEQWAGSAEVWMVARQNMTGFDFAVKVTQDAPEKVMPPLPYASDIKKEHIRLGAVESLALRR